MAKRKGGQRTTPEPGEKRPPAPPAPPMKAEATCPMCGVPYTQHDGLISMCRRYHRLRVEIRALINEWKGDPRKKTLDRIGQLEWALKAAETN